MECVAGHRVRMESNPLVSGGARKRLNCETWGMRKSKQRERLEHVHLHHLWPVP